MQTMQRTLVTGSIAPPSLGAPRALAAHRQASRTLSRSSFRNVRSLEQLVAPRPLSSGRRQEESTSGFSRDTVYAAAGTSHPAEERQGADDLLRQVRVPMTGMAKGVGSFGGATMQRSKLSQKQEMKQEAPKVDNSGGGGGIGKGISNGGGGGDDGDDDDDYFDDFDEGDGNGDGDSFFRTVIGQLYDARTIAAVMQEWFRTVGDLPTIIRQSVEMGLFSSAQLVRFMSMDVRPNVTRTVTRRLPASFSRGIVGRLMADPAFIQKLAVEQLITVGSSLYWEAQQRGERFSKELDLVAINTLSLAAANMALVWLVAPNRSYGAAHKYSWQTMLHKLPNHVFDASGPQRQYTGGMRAAGLFAKTAELCAVGTIAGAAMSGLSQAAVSLRRMRNPDFQPSVAIPSIGRSAGGLAASMGVFGNLRYQVVGGIDRYLFDHSSYLWSYLTGSGAFRVVSNRLGEPTRLALQGLPEKAPVRKSPIRQSASSVTPVARRKRAAGTVKRVRKVKVAAEAGASGAAASSGGATVAAA